MARGDKPIHLNTSGLERHWIDPIDYRRTLQLQGDRTHPDRTFTATLTGVTT